MILLRQDHPIPLQVLSVSRKAAGTLHQEEDFFCGAFPQFKEHVTRLPDFERLAARKCRAFLYKQTVFMSLPAVSSLAPTRWQDGEFQSCITNLIELAEEQTGCHSVIIALDRGSISPYFDTILRALMYMGFQPIAPTIYNQRPGLVLVGYEL